MDIFHKLLPYFKPYRRQLLFGIVGTCIYTLLRVMPPLLVRALVDRVIQPKAWHLLLPMAGVILLVPALAALINFITVRNIVSTAQRLVTDIRRKLYNRILCLGMRYHGTESAGMLVNRLMSDINMLQGLISGQTLKIVADVITLAFSLAVTFTISWKLSSLMGLMLILYVLAYKYFSSRIRVSSSFYRSKIDQISGRLQETVAGVQQVRIYNREEWETGTFLDRTTDSLKKALSTSKSSITLSTSCNIISGIGSTIIVCLSAYMVLKQTISFGDLVAFDAYLWMAISPIVRLATMAGQMAETFVSVNRIFEVMDATPAIQSQPGAPSITHGKGAVEFRDVTFSYTHDMSLYHGLNLKIDQGTTVALVGATGCGKTTLTSLLMRHWDIQEGAILIDGVDIRTVDLKSLRQLFGVVLQSPVVLEGTLAENIAYGEPGASRARIEEATRAAEIYELAMSLPHGLDSVIGSKGVQLSVGEKQRVSIARAILKDPVILIMDEATSALDSESEMLIQKALARVLAHRTSIVVAHRLSTIVTADKIVVMDNGRIMETGTHLELMAMHDGMYRKLYEELQGQKQGGEV